jgi:hypothetical protein
MAANISINLLITCENNAFIQWTIYQIEARNTERVMIFEPPSSTVSLQSYKQNCKIIIEIHKSNMAANIFH